MAISLAPNWLPIIYLPIHSLLVIASQRTRSSKIKILGTNIFLILFFSAQIYSQQDIFNHSWLGRFTVLWSPIIFFWFGYLWAGLTLTSIHREGHFFDRPIAVFEEKYFRQPSLNWGKNRSRLMTELFHFGYFSYYFYTLVLGIVYDTFARLEEFQAMSFAVNFGYLVSYVCFALVPVAGPRWFLVDNGQLSETDVRQPGYLFTKLTHKLLFGGPAHKGGAMPSSHSSTAFVFLFFVTYSFGGYFGLAALLLVAGMWIGAVYGRYHYLTDVVVGILLGFAGVAFGFLIV